MIGCSINGRWTWEDRAQLTGTFSAHEQDIAGKGSVKRQANGCELLNKAVVFLWEFLDQTPGSRDTCTDFMESNRMTGGILCRVLANESMKFMFMESWWIILGEPA